MTGSWVFFGESTTRELATKEQNEKEGIYLHIHSKWTPRIMFLITLLSSSQFYPGSSSSPEMSPNHDAFLWVNLISDGGKIPQCSELFVHSVYIHLVKSWRHFSLYFFVALHNSLCAQLNVRLTRDKVEQVGKQLKVVRRRFLVPLLRNVNI